MDTAKTYRTPGNHSFTAEPVRPVEVFTTDDTEYISAGQTVTDQQGNRFTVLEVRHVLDRLWRVVLLSESR